MSAKLGIIQQNYNMIEKINLKVWAKRSKYKTMQKKHHVKVLVLLQLLVSIVVRKWNKLTPINLLSSKTPPHEEDQTTDKTDKLFITKC